MTAQSFFTFGLHQDGFFHGKDAPGTPTVLEERVQQIFKEDIMLMAGKPDLIVFCKTCASRSRRAEAVLSDMGSLRRLGL